MLLDSRCLVLLSQIPSLLSMPVHLQVYVEKPKPEILQKAILFISKDAKMALLVSKQCNSFANES